MHPEGLSAHDNHQAAASEAFPKAFRENMKSLLRSSYPEFEAAHNQVPPVSIRYNPKKKIPTEPVGNPIPWTKQGAYLPERKIFTLDPLFHAGSYYVQGATSMFLEQIVEQLKPFPQKLNVLDLCAAPGGKSTHLLSLLPENALLVSNEAIRTRIGPLHENLTKWGYANQVITNSDPAKFGELAGFFDMIVIDAPCSGEGLFRTDPDAMGHWSTEHVAHCAQRQHRIIEDVWPALKENGVIIYSTCTYNHEENERILEWINTKYNVHFIDTPLSSSWGIEKITERDCIGYRFYPHRLEGEGFFISAFRKLEKSESALSKRGTKNLSESKINLSDWIEQSDEQFIFASSDENISFLPASMVSDVDLLTTHIHPISIGTQIASIKGNKHKPAQPLANSVLRKDAFPVLELEEQEAIRFLRKEPVGTDGMPVGFTLVTHRGIGLGWLNIIAGRANNLYPMNWRIRMR